MKRVLLPLFLCLLTFGGLVAETLHIADPLLALESPDETELVRKTLSRALVAAAEQLEPYVTVRTGGQAGTVRADANITTVATDFGNGPGVSMTYTGSDGQSGTFNFSAEFGPNTALELANGIVYLHLTYGEDIQPEGEPPALLSSLDSRSLGAETTIPFRVLSVHSSGTGELTLGLSTSVFRVDEYFRRVATIGGDLSSRFVSFAYLAFSAPGGQTVTVGNNLNELYRIPFEGAEPRRVPLPGYQVTSASLMTDGTLAMHDMSGQAAVLVSPDNSIRELPIRGSFDVFPQITTSGPENTLWSWDAVQRGVGIWSPEGERLGSVLPLLPPEEYTISLLIPYPDGSFLVSATNGLYKFDRAGFPQWFLPWDQIHGIRSANGIMNGTMDPSTGMIYLVNIMDGMVYQLLDREYRSDVGAIGSQERRLISLQEELGRSPASLNTLTALAEEFERMEAWELAARYWREARDRDPSSTIAAEGAARVEVELLWREATIVIARASRKLQQFGPANARADYENALRLLEQIIALSPGNEQAMEERGALEELYAQQFAPLELASVQVQEIFPSLIQQLQRDPVGEVTIRNPNDNAVSNVRLEARLADFMSEGWESSPVLSLGAGASFSVDLRLPVEQSILNLNTRLVNAPLRLTVRYEIDNQEREITFTEGITVHPVTALTWEESGKLATYVTPADTYVNQFSSTFRAINREASSWGVSADFLRAARLADAVGSHGIEYIQDPQLGIASILGDPTVVDSVQLPRTTLWYRRGDCDDTTALLASVFESVSISTAIMTSPDHVFLAFDSGQPEQDAWMFDSETTVAIPYNGTLWIPFETTILDQGFLASWEEGSRLVRRYGASAMRRIPEDGNDGIEFLPIQLERERYPALPVDALDDQVFQLLPPLETQVDELHTTSVSSIRRVLYSDSLASLQGELNSQNGRQGLRTLNQVGVLHAQFGEYGRARSAFEQALSRDDEYVATYLNLANLELITNNPRAALRQIDAADQIRRPGILSSLIRAQALYALGDIEEARTRMGLVEQEAPELAALYPHLSGVSGARASDAAAQRISPWAIEDSE
jgi:tetratricopeptide (TPR) repeat protein